MQRLSISKGNTIIPTKDYYKQRQITDITGSKKFPAMQRLSISKGNTIIPTKEYYKQDPDQRTPPAAISSLPGSASPYLKVTPSFLPKSIKNKSRSRTPPARQPSVPCQAAPLHI
jgi:hypothetical protein